jgi:hypothetical protein
MIVDHANGLRSVTITGPTNLDPLQLLRALVISVFAEMFKPAID